MVTESRILLITNDFLPHKGGSRIYYFNVYKRMIDQVTVLTHKTDGWREFDADSGFDMLRVKLGYSNIKIEKLRELINYTKLFFSSLYAVLARRIKVIHAGEVLPTGLIAYVFKKLFGIPYMVYIHGEEIEILSNESVNEFKVAKTVLKNANKIIAASSFSEGLLLKHGISGCKIEKVFPGVDESLFEEVSAEDASNIKEKLNLGGKKVLLTVGRLVTRKGHIRMIEALPKVLRSFPDVIYLIVGDGPEHENISKRVKELSLESNVRFLNEVSHDDLILLYSVCDIFVMPNRLLANGDTEGFGMVFVEAGVFQKPVIGGISGGTCDSIVDGQTGFRVDPENVDELSSKVIALLADDELSRNFGESGRKRANDKFRWDDKAERIKGITYEFCLNG